MTAKTALWIDDDIAEQEFARDMLRALRVPRWFVVGSSPEAQEILERESIDAVVTDVLRRRTNGSMSGDDGYRFVKAYIRMKFPRLPVIFHTKNLPTGFLVDDKAHYLSKWEQQPKKCIELESILHDEITLYEAFADHSVWSLIEPRLVQIQSRLIDRLERFDDVWALSDSQFEELVGELLGKIGYDVLWVPGGRDGGVDIVAASADYRYLIDVKRYRGTNPVSVELVRRVYGVAEAAGKERPDRITRGGIITSSRFTLDAQRFRDSVRERPLLKDGVWLKSTLTKYVPRLATA